MILITGATGTIGRALIAELRGMTRLRAMTRDPESARSAVGPDVEIVRADFDDGSSLGPALAGVDAVFLLSAPGPSLPTHDLALARALRGTAIRKVVKLSSFGADASPALSAATWHRPGELAVMESGLAWTILRPAGFMSNALGWTGSIREGKAIQVGTADGRHAVIDPRDVAAVAASALTSSGHDGKAYTLTGPAALSVPDQVAILGEALGKNVAIEAVTPEVAADRMASAGAPPVFVEAVREGYGFVRSGRAAEVTNAVGTVLGRSPRTFAEWVGDHIRHFR